MSVDREFEEGMAASGEAGESETTKLFATAAEVHQYERTLAYEATLALLEGYHGLYETEEHGVLREWRDLNDRHDLLPAKEAAQAVAYLEWRGLLERHPEQANLVCFRDECEPDASAPGARPTLRQTVCSWCGWATEEMTPENDHWADMVQHISCDCPKAPHRQLMTMLEEAVQQIKAVRGYLVTALPMNQPEWLEYIPAITGPADAVVEKVESFFAAVEAVQL